MSTDLFATRSVSPATGIAVPLREMLGYDPFRRFMPNVDPEMEVVRSENGWDIDIAVPGYRPDQIELVVKEDVLTISARSEKRAFTRSVRLPQEVDTENIEASVEYGILALRLKRHPDTQPRKIEIKQPSA